LKHLRLTRFRRKTPCADFVASEEPFFGLLDDDLEAELGGGLELSLSDRAGIRVYEADNTVRDVPVPLLVFFLRAIPEVPIPKGTGTCLSCTSPAVFW